ncbi:MAG TPA: AMP-binding protein, partial [Bacteroidota bacterium]|nr:AMP-binding protein [Bacteroidota bacterium]
MTARFPLHTVPAISSVQDMVLRSARVYGEKIALEDLKDYPIPRLTYASLLRNILRFGVALRAMGIKERSHVAVIGENRVQWSLAYLTSMCFNYVVVPVDRALTSNEILNILHESDATAVIYSEAFEPLLRESRMSMKNLKYYINMDAPAKKDRVFSMVELIEQSPGCSTEQLPRIDPEELAEIIFTSGSLGRAKGVMLSQLNLADNLMAMVKYIRITPEDRFLGVLPIHHTYACTCGFLCPMYAGASLHFAQSLKTIVDDLQTVHATILLAVPLLYDKMFKRVYRTIQEKRIASMIVGPLIKAGAVAEKFGWRGFRRMVFGEIHEKFGGSIRLFIAGGAAQDPMVAKGLREFGFCFVQGYGLTETAPILTLNRMESFKDDS